MVGGLAELRLSVPEAGKRLLPLPIAVWDKDVGKRVLKPVAKATTCWFMASWFVASTDRC